MTTNAENKKTTEQQEDDSILAVAENLQQELREKGAHIFLSTVDFFKELISWDKEDLIASLKRTKEAYLLSELADDCKERSTTLFYIDLLLKWLYSLEHLEQFHIKQFDKLNAHQVFADHVVPKQ